MQDRYFSDEELVAYLDGETEFAPHDEIKQALPRDPALQARVEALYLDLGALRDDFAGLEPDRPLLALPMVQPVRRGLWAAACAACFAGALGLGYVLGAAQQPALSGWADYVAAYQALYSNSTLAHVHATTATQQAQLDRVAASVGKSISVDSLSIFPDVGFRRAQVLSFKGKPLVQLAFLTSTGEPVALCIIRAQTKPDTPPSFGRLEGLSAGRWAQNGYEYILIGGQDDGLIQRMSNTFAGMQI
jgi:anti-sigma factor RsiW